MTLMRNPSNGFQLNRRITLNASFRNRHSRASLYGAHASPLYGVTSLDAISCWTRSRRIEFSRPTGRAARLVEAASNAGVPGVACLSRRRAQTLAEVLQTVRHNQASDVFHALVAELTRHAQPERTTVPDRKIPAVHAVGEKRLRVQRVGHIDAAPPT